MSYTIWTHSKEHFNECFKKLAAVGFVYSCYDCKTVEEIDKHFPYYNVIIIVGEESLWSNSYQLEGGNAMSGTHIKVDEFIEQVLPTWKARKIKKKRIFT